MNEERIDLLYQRLLTVDELIEEHERWLKRLRGEKQTLAARLAAAGWEVSNAGD